MKICISISTYDAYEDVNISASLIRANWPNNHDLYLVTGLCQRDPNHTIDRDLIDNVLQIDTPRYSRITLNGELSKHCWNTIKDNTLNSQNWRRRL